MEPWDLSPICEPIPPESRKRQILRQENILESSMAASMWQMGNRRKKSNAKIQDAHEAIRPTDIALTPVMVKESLQRDLFRLYQLIWKRFAASRMQPAVYETTSVKVGAGSYVFTLSASRLSFDGFMSVYVQEDDKEDNNVLLGNLEKGSILKLDKLESGQHFTQPPAHFTEPPL